MFRFLFISVAVVAMVCVISNCAVLTRANISTTTPKKVDFDQSKLSPNGKAAYESLLQADKFETGHIGVAGILSKYIIDLNTLLAEKEGDAALKALVVNAKPAGQLYALSGLYFTDHEAFKTEIERFRAMDESIDIVAGCTIYPQKISEIVETKAQKVIIIKPGEKIEDWYAAHKDGGYFMDIANGGYPASFKRYANEKKNR